MSVAWALTTLFLQSSEHFNTDPAIRTGVLVRHLHCTITYRGVAPNANIINLRALDANGQASDSEVIAAIQAAISLKSQYNIRVINLSLGRGIYESYTLDPLDQAVEQAWQAGIVVVVAAGNYGRATIPITMTDTEPLHRLGTIPM